MFSLMHDIIMSLNLTDLTFHVPKIARVGSIICLTNHFHTFHIFLGSPKNRETKSIYREMYHPRCLNNISSIIQIK